MVTTNPSSITSVRRESRRSKKAVAILNGLPAMSDLSADLREFPTEAKRLNYRASALGIIDLKSMALGILVEELGLACPERYTWTLRDRRVIVNIPQYLVIQRNFDPVTWRYSAYVNGTLYTLSHRATR